MTVYTRTEERAEEISRKIRKECEADIVIGIPTYNNERTIGHVLLTIQAGLACFPDLKAVIVTADAGSTDGTIAIARNSAIRKIPVYISRPGPTPWLAPHDPYPPSQGRAEALRAIFETAEELDARACAILDADLKSIVPEWISRLFKPVLENAYDHVSPLYRLNKFDSMITNTILYPLTRALYGKRVRQPIGGNFCVSGRLARFYLKLQGAESGLPLYGEDIRLLIEAMANDFKSAEVFLGQRIRESAGTPGVTTLLPRIMGAAFDLVESHQHVWKSVRGSVPVPLFGSQSGAIPDEVKGEVDGMLAVFRQGVRDLKEIWTSIMGAEEVSLLEYIAFRPEGRFHITPTFWARIVYSYAIAYHRKNVSIRHLLSSFTPLYLGNAASYFLEVLAKGHQETEAEIEKLCLAFEDGKDYLGRNWRA
jgi:glycosyltransferase involved in cell wall biosynthesis